MTPEEYYRELVRRAGFEDFWVLPRDPESIRDRAKQLRETMRAIGRDMTWEEAISSVGKTLGPNDVLASIKADIESGLTPEESANLDDSLFVGQFPTGDPNACVTSAPSGGFLVLVNLGLMQLIHQLMIVLCSRVRIQPLGWHIGRIRIPRPFARVEEDVDVSFPRVKSWFMGAIQSYFQYEDLPPLPAASKPGRRRYMVALLTDSIERFVVAHEYGHVIRRHLGTPVREEVTMHGARISLIPKTWEQEYEADRLGCLLMMRPFLEARKLGAKPKTFRKTVEWWLAGPPLALEIVHMLEHVRGAGGGSHPPASGRGEQVRQLIVAEFPYLQLHHVLREGLADFFRKALADVQIPGPSPGMTGMCG